MLHAVRPLGRIVAAAMVDEPVALKQDWLTGSGVTLSGTSIGTRAQLRALLAIHGAEPLQAEIERIGLRDATMALISLAKGRYCIIF